MKTATITLQVSIPDWYSEEDLLQIAKEIQTAVKGWQVKETVTGYEVDCP